MISTSIYFLERKWTDTIIFFIICFALIFAMKNEENVCFFFTSYTVNFVLTIYVVVFESIRFKNISSNCDLFQKNHNRITVFLLWSKRSAVDEIRTSRNFSKFFHFSFLYIPFYFRTFFTKMKFFMLKITGCICSPYFLFLNLQFHWRITFCSVVRESLCL